MPKIVVIYDSRSGNTEEMAKAVAEGVNSVKGVEVELHKVGTRFPITIIDEADAIILGSPTYYGNVTPEMRAFIESALELKTAKKLRLRGKIGGVFGSYGWDGGWAAGRLGELLKSLGIKLVPPIVSALDQMGGPWWSSTNSKGVCFNEESLRKCRELGRTMAQKLVKT